jgi:hypothetical protein
VVEGRYTILNVDKEIENGRSSRLRVLGVGGDDHGDNSSKGNDGIDGYDRS